MYTVHIISSSTIDTLYSGIISDVSVRLQQHPSGQFTYTRRASDGQAVCCIEVSTASKADLLERKIKKAKRRKSILR